MDIPKTHISLNVRDIEQSVAFYEAFFGMPAHKRRPGYANFAVEAPPLKLALNEDAPIENEGTSRLSHLGIQVGTAEEVAAARERLAAVVTFDEGDTVCCYARQDKVWVTDPDGNSWEIYVLLDEMDDHDNHEFAVGGVAVGEVACCSDAPSVPAAARVASGVPLAMAGSCECGGNC